MAVLWAIIFILIVALAIISGYCIIYWIDNDKNIVTAISEANRVDTMVAHNQFCANCQYCGKCNNCLSPRLSYEKINPVTGKAEKHLYVASYETDCKKIIGTKYCQWENKEN